MEAKSLDEENVMAYLDIVYEDGQDVGLKDSVSKSENYFTTSPTSKYEVKLGPFQFNVCSYKHDVRKFRLIVYFIVAGNEKPSCCLISPPFLIKAKKPISKPGIKSKSGKKKRSVTPSPQKIKKTFASPNPKKIKLEEVPQVYANFSSPVPLFDSFQKVKLSLQKLQSPVPENQQTTDFEFLETLRLEDDVLKPTTIPMEEQLQSFDKFDVSQVKIEPITPPSQNVEQFLNAFDSLNEKDRKTTLCSLIEKCQAHEKEFLNRKYFSVQPQSYVSGFPMQSDIANYLTEL
jgi:hypothetical protein